MSKFEIYDLLIQKSFKINISQKLRGFTTATDRISQVRKKYHIIILNLENRTVSVVSYTARQIEEANEFYTEIEQQIATGDPIQAVLVSTGSIDNLRKAYPNYFLDTRAFLDILNEIYHTHERMKSE